MSDCSVFCLPAASHVCSVLASVCVIDTAVVNMPFSGPVYTFVILVSAAVWATVSSRRKFARSEPPVESINSSSDSAKVFAVNMDRVSPVDSFVAGGHRQQQRESYANPHRRRSEDSIPPVAIIVIVVLCIFIVLILVAVNRSITCEFLSLPGVTDCYQGNRKSYSTHV